ncbi:MAG: type I-E CRISPR-associated protein Cas6/Cse3/CasE, partial [Desulfococcaceae bacterium]|nr:type I-E CRISPR-associated protein Cas6/Cse3/CasE [Desulfococcaceae bacterium]
MYLSKIAIAANLIRNPYRIHRCLWELFPDMPDSDRPFLYRMESANSESDVRILMQSEIAPKQNSESVRIIASREANLKLNDGQYLRFLLI